MAGVAAASAAAVLSATPPSDASGDGTQARATVSTATLVRETALWQMTPPAPDPSGIVYRPDVDRLLVVDSEVNEMPLYQGVNLWQTSRAGNQVFETGTTLGFSKEPTGASYDPVGKRLFISDDDRERVFELTAGPDARFGSADDGVTWFSTIAFGNDDAEDVAYDTSTGDLYVTQGMAQEIWRVSPGANNRFDGIPPTGDDTVSHFDVGVHGSLDVEGLAYYGLRDSLFLADRKLKQIIEVSKTGLLIQTIDTSGIPMRAPAGLTLAPRSDDSSRMSLYVVTRGRDNNSYPDENDGMLYELSGAAFGPLPANGPPTVDAGPDIAVRLPTSASLHGEVTDDGRPDPPGQTTVAWSKLSGPGAVQFSHPGQVDTAAGFSAAGTYVLRLVASDSALTVADTVTVVATGIPLQVALKCQGVAARIQIGPGTDDLLRGTDGVDLLRGERGDDILLGGGGNDCLEGGAGNDVVRGQGGKDLLKGNGGRDRLLGAGGADRILPGSGRDTVDAGRGHDRVGTADGKRDVVRCGAGADRAVVDGQDRVAASCEQVVVKAASQ